MMTGAEVPETDRQVEWEHFSHDADIGVRGWGLTPAEAFESAALGLARAVTGETIQPLEKVEVSCEAADLETLLVEWLNAVIYEMAVRNMLFGRFKVDIEGQWRLHGVLAGEPVDIARHGPAVEPKGATFTALRVCQEAPGRWVAACVIDV